MSIDKSAEPANRPMRQSDIQSVGVPMQVARAVAVVLCVVTVVGCSTGDEKSRPSAQEAGSTSDTSDLVGPSGSLTTLPWDRVDLEGGLLGIDDRRKEDCTTDTCVLGMFTITDAVAATSSGSRLPIADTRLLVTEETQLLGCGPSDARERISFDQFLARPSEVTGESPTAVWVWTTGGVNEQPPDLAVAAQVVSGSCG